MSKFADKLKKLFGLHPERTEDFFDGLTDILIEGDIGAKTAVEITGEIAGECKQSHSHDETGLYALLRKKLASSVRPVALEPAPGSVNVYVVLGVNGAGKTTSVAKMAQYYRQHGNSVIIAAADTFRAAAIEQLQIHGERLGVRVVAHQHGADPSAVVFDAAAAAAAKGSGLVLVDTAGRLHNKENLVRELQKIDRTAAAKASPGCYKKILVLDSTTGQNALRQAEVFHEAVGVDAVVLTKCDSTAKGGIAVSLGRELGLPVAFVCSGESYGDIAVFDPEHFVNAFMEKSL